MNMYMYAICAYAHTSVWGVAYAECHMCHCTLAEAHGAGIRGCRWGARTDTCRQGSTLLRLLRCEGRPQMEGRRAPRAGDQRSLRYHTGLAHLRWSSASSSFNASTLVIQIEAAAAASVLALASIKASTFCTLTCGRKAGVRILPAAQRRGAHPGRGRSAVG